MNLSKYYVLSVEVKKLVLEYAVSDFHPKKPKPKPKKPKK